MRLCKLRETYVDVYLNEDAKLERSERRTDTRILVHGDDCCHRLQELQLPKLRPFSSTSGYAVTLTIEAELDWKWRRGTDTELLYSRPEQVLVAGWYGRLCEEEAFYSILEGVEAHHQRERIETMLRLLDGVVGMLVIKQYWADECRKSADLQTRLDVDLGPVAAGDEAAERQISHTNHLILEVAALADTLLSWPALPLVRFDEPASTGDERKDSAHD